MKALYTLVHILLLVFALVTFFDSGMRSINGMANYLPSIFILMLSMIAQNAAHNSK